MRLTVVGCSGSYPGPDSPASCYLVEARKDGRDWRILLDLGSGAFGPLQRYIDPLTVDAVLVTHLHPDHYFDLSGFYVMRKYHPSGHQGPVAVWGPTGIAGRVAGAYGVSIPPGMSEEFDFHEYDGGPLDIGPFHVTVARVVHPVEAYAIRVAADDRSVTYSGDTGPCEALVDLATGADVLLAEAAFRDGDDNPVGLHMTGSDAAFMARQAEVGRLMLTHIPPWHDKAIALTEAKSAYDGPVELAYPGAVHQL